MDNYVIRYLWTSSQKKWWYHLRVSNGETYSTAKITHPDVEKIPADKVKKTIFLIKKNHRGCGYTDELVLEIVDIRTHKVVSLKELEFMLPLDFGGGISRFELIDFD